MARTRYSRDELLEMTAALGNGLIQSDRFFDASIVVQHATRILETIDKQMEAEKARAEQEEKRIKDKELADLRSGVTAPTQQEYHGAGGLGDSRKD
jgi:hypothetical protein